MANKIWTVLFDIDGTLMRTGGAGFKAIGRALSELFGIESLPSVPVHGRTDLAIFHDFFERSGEGVNWTVGWCV